MAACGQPEGLGGEMKHREHSLHSSFSFVKNILQCTRLLLGDDVWITCVQLEPCVQAACTGTGLFVGFVPGSERLARCR